jgi:hypothetical protein
MVTTMQIVSVDHSPSEQLGPDDQWHTSVVVASPGNEHYSLSKELARCIGTQSEVLVKWSGRKRRNYAERFEEELGVRIAKYPAQIRAISATARTIRAVSGQYVAQLGLSEAVERLDINGRRSLQFGPFIRLRNNGVREANVFFALNENRALSLLHIAHFLLRTHQELFRLAQAQQPDVNWMDWQIMPNKFPGGMEGDMASLFHAIMSGAAHARLAAGNMRIMTLRNPRDDLGAALADNIAGLLREKLNQGDRSFALPQAKWEIWRLDG